MLFSCEFCDEEGMELNECRVLTPWHPTKEYMESIDMKCVHCGVHEPCESDDLIGFMMQILDEHDFQTAMLKTLRILWKHEHMKEMIE